LTEKPAIRHQCLSEIACRSNCVLNCRHTYVCYAYLFHALTLFSVGELEVNFNDTLDTLIDSLNDVGVLAGGRGQPDTCRARHKVAIIIPYRDRKLHVVKLLAHLHPILKRQQLDYRIYVVEQVNR
jgi:hypothetical protein